jgi:hypothetical protein
VNERVQLPAKPTSAPARHLASEPSGILRRKCGCGGSGRDCAQCDKKSMTLQRQSTGDTGMATASLGVQDRTFSQSGREFSKPRFGHDFGSLRLHGEAELAELALGSPILQRQDAETGDAGAGGVAGPASGPGAPGPAGPPAAAGASGAAAAPALNLKAIRIAFNTAGAPNPANCSRLQPAALGVGVGGSARNNMEMVFRIDGTIPTGTEFDILRTRVSSAWQRDAAGAWTVLERDPAGTNDDNTNDDECLTPRPNKIFVSDIPGLPRRDPRGITLVGGSTVSATATAFVRKFSFAEWVIARNRSLGIGFKVISAPTFTFWHSITSVAQGAGGVFNLVDTPGGQHNEIALGSINTGGATP